MKTLEEEAKGYIDIYCDGNPYLSRADMEDMLASFVQKSKYVQVEKIKAQIDILENIYYLNKSIKYSLNELKQQLKDLEDE